MNTALLCRLRSRTILYSLGVVGVMSIAAVLHYDVHLTLVHPPLRAHGKLHVHVPESTAHSHPVANTLPTKENRSFSSQQSQGQLRTTVGISFSEMSIAPSDHEAHPSASRPHPSASRPQGYLLAVGYEQQLTAALKGFAQLSTIADSLNLFSVEPFVQNNQLKGVPIIEGKLTKPFWKLGMLYNISEMQKSLEDCISASYKLSNIKQMVEQASRKVIVVFLMTSTSDEMGDKRIIIRDNSSPRPDAEFVIHILNTYVYYWLKQTSSFQHYKHFVFYWSKVFMIDARPFHSTSFGSIREALMSAISAEVAKGGSATVLIEKWRGVHTSKSKFFYFMPDFSWDEDKCDLNALQASNLVIKAAHNFSLHVNLSQPQIGIHIRGERLLIDSHGNTSYYITCLEQLKTLLKTILSHYGGTNKNVVAFHDLGPYGSISCTHGYCLNGRVDFLSILETYNFPIMYYNPAILKYTPQNAAFASFVEREFLSQVDVLITLGWGGFQQSIVERFHTSGARQKDLYRLCFRERRNIYTR